MVLVNAFSASFLGGSLSCVLTMLFQNTSPCKIGFALRFCKFLSTKEILMARRQWNLLLLSRLKTLSYSNSTWQFVLLLNTGGGVSKLSCAQKCSLISLANPHTYTHCLSLSLTGMYPSCKWPCNAFLTTQVFSSPVFLPYAPFSCLLHHFPIFGHFSQLNNFMKYLFI